MLPRLYGSFLQRLDPRSRIGTDIVRIPEGEEPLESCSGPSSSRAEGERRVAGQSPWRAPVGVGWSRSQRFDPVRAAFRTAGLARLGAAAMLRSDFAKRANARGRRLARA